MFFLSQMGEGALKVNVGSLTFFSHATLRNAVPPSPFLVIFCFFPKREGNKIIMVWIWNAPTCHVLKAWSPVQQCSEVGLLGSDWITRAVMKTAGPSQREWVLGSVPLGTAIACPWLLPLFFSLSLFLSLPP